MTVRDLATATWRKSNHCGESTCVEVAPVGQGHIAVRDGKNPAAPALIVTRKDWARFIETIKQD